MKAFMIACFALLAAPALAQQTAPEIAFDSVPDFPKLPQGMKPGKPYDGTNIRVLLVGTPQFIGFEQRCIGVYCDFELARSGFINIGSKLRQSTARYPSVRSSRPIRSVRHSAPPLRPSTLLPHWGQSPFDCTIRNLWGRSPFRSASMLTV